MHRRPLDPAPSLASILLLALLSTPAAARGARMASDGCQPLVINGQVRGFNKDNQGGKISFPAGVTNYRDLRTGGKASTLQAGTVPEGDSEFRTRALYGRNNKAHEKTLFNDEGIPIGQTNATGTNYAPKSAPARAGGGGGGRAARPAAAPIVPPPAPLAESWPLAGSGRSLPAVGWRCSAADAAATVTAGCALVDARGDAATESALSAAFGATDDAARAASFVMTSVDDAEAAATQCVERFGGQAPDLLVLAATAASWPAAATAARAAAPSATLGISCAGGPAAAVELLNQVFAGPGPLYPAVLQLPLDPTSAKVARMLVGLCKRKSIRLIATEPLGGAAAASVVQERAAAAANAADAAGASKVLLAWSVGRGVAALPCGAELGGMAVTAAVAAGLVSAAALEPIEAGVRSALDAFATQDGLRAAAVTGVATSE